MITLKPTNREIHPEEYKGLKINFREFMVDGRKTQVHALYCSPRHKEKIFEAIADNESEVLEKIKEMIDEKEVGEIPKFKPSCYECKDDLTVENLYPCGYSEVEGKKRYFCKECMRKDMMLTEKEFAKEMEKNEKEATHKAVLEGDKVVWKKIIKNEEKGIINIKFEGHKKKDYKDICPNCGSEDVEEIVGWCYNHGSPDLKNKGLFFCDHPPIESFISKVKGAFFCHGCDFIYDKYKMVDWNKYDFFGGCPVGKEYDETPEEYSEKLYSFLIEYDEIKTNKILDEGYFLEAIGCLHIQISEQLRFLLIKKVKGDVNIPLDYSDNRFNAVVDWVKSLKDYNLHQISYIFKRINKNERDDLHSLNNLRNKFAHSLSERKCFSDRQIKNIIKKSQEIEKRLKVECEKYGSRGLFNL